MVGESCNSRETRFIQCSSSLISLSPVHLSTSLTYRNVLTAALNFNGSNGQKPARPSRAGDRKELRQCLSASTVHLAHQHLLSIAEESKMRQQLLSSGTAVKFECFGADVEKMARAAAKTSKPAACSKDHNASGDFIPMVARSLHDKNVRGAKAVLPKARVRNLTEKEYVQRMCHIGCMDHKCEVCVAVDGPPRRFLSKVDPFKETRPGFSFSLDMIEFDWRAFDSSKYVPQLRCRACHMMFEMTSIFKDNFYDKFDQFLSTLRSCQLYKHCACKVISHIKLDNNSVWSEQNVRFRELRLKYDIDCDWPSNEDTRDASEAEETCKIVEHGVKKALF